MQDKLTPNKPKQLLLFEPVTEYRIIESLYEQPSDDQETLFDKACPECDSLLERFHDDRGNPKYFCDNCGMLVHGSTSLMISDMDIS